MKSTIRWSALVTACALAIILGARPGPATAGNDRAAAGAVSDSWITAKTKIALFGDDRVSGWDVNVDTRNGVVTLLGKVESAEAKAAAGEVARTIEGVRDVKNQLQIVPRSERERVDARDEDIADRVEKQLDRDRQLENGDINVEANDGIVRLTGEVETLDLSARASEQARRIPGVRAVTNELELKRDDRLSRRDDRPGMAGRGDRERVRMAQEILMEKGHDPGPIDGAMGRQTRAALREFQKAEGLRPTGRLDGPTIARLGLEESADR
jgi:osmotically-inducible protein OsmY